MNLTDEQKNLLRLLVSKHESFGGQPFILVRSRTGSGLIYGRNSVPIQDDVLDFQQLKRGNLIAFSPQGANTWRGKPTANGVALVRKGFLPSPNDPARLAAIPSQAVAEGSRSQFWKDRQAEFEKYAKQYPTLEADWFAPDRKWLLSMSGNTRETAGGVARDPWNVSQECKETFNAIARKAVTAPELSVSDPGVAREAGPWELWLNFMKERNWGFREGSDVAYTEWERTEMAKSGMTLAQVRLKPGHKVEIYRRTRGGKLRRLSATELKGKSSEDLRKYHLYLYNGTIERVFETSARFCEDLASRVFEDASVRLAEGPEKMIGSAAAESASWRRIREDFESLPSGRYSFIWTSRPTTSFSGIQLSSHWSYYHPTDPSLRARLGAVMLKAAKSRGWDSEDAWLDELRESDFVGFKTSGSGRDKLPDGTYVEYESGVLNDAVKHSITLCHILEAGSTTSSFQPFSDGGREDVPNRDPHGATKTSANRSSGTEGERPLSGANDPTDRRKADGASWQAVEISFLSDERVQIRNGTDTETRNYGELGFADRRTGKPNRAWTVLRLLAESRGTICDAARTGQDWPRVEKRIQEIRKVFRKHFSITADPIPFVEGTGYQACFKIGCSPSYHT